VSEPGRDAQLTIAISTIICLLLSQLIGYAVGLAFGSVLVALLSAFAATVVPMLIALSINGWDKFWSMGDE
jgi:predicted lysophospholipase L1 biosynthesis ABC-type transport system permease subunit